MTAVHFIRDGVFVCLAEPTDSCRNYPACDCEHWSRELHGQQRGDFIGRAPTGHALYANEDIPVTPGHETVPQDDCWIGTWINADALHDSYFGPINHKDVYNEAYGMTFPDGPVEHDWQGDYMQWHYADSTVPVWEDDE